MMKTSAKLIKTTFSLPKQQMRYLDEEAKKRGLPRIEILRRIIDEHRDQQSKMLNEKKRMTRAS